ncbi:hypothetical protein HDU91_002248, partial [Kappamyces sp. JEL0680]
HCSGNQIVVPNQQGNRKVFDRGKKGLADCTKGAQAAPPWAIGLWEVYASEAAQDPARRWVFDLGAESESIIDPCRDFEHMSSAGVLYGHSDYWIPRGMSAAADRTEIPGAGKDSPRRPRALCRAGRAGQGVLGYERVSDGPSAAPAKQSARDIHL